MKEKNKLIHKDVNIKIPEEEIIKYYKEEKEYEIIGQPRALKALRIGTEISSKGYKVFVTGLSGTGKLLLQLKCGRRLWT